MPRYNPDIIVTDFATDAPAILNGKELTIRTAIILALTADFQEERQSGISYDEKKRRGRIARRFKAEGPVTIGSGEETVLIQKLVAMMFTPAVVVVLDDMLEAPVASDPASSANG